MEDEMKKELNGIRQAIASLAKEMRAGFSASADMTRRIAIKAAEHDVALSDIRREMATKKDLSAFRSEMLANFDGFAAIYDDRRLKWAAHRDMLNTHERRIARLEARLP